MIMSKATLLTVKGSFTLHRESTTKVEIQENPKIKICIGIFTEARVY